MTHFTIIGHMARTDPSFSLNDLPGSGGRMDLLCRAVQATLFTSHGIREDAICSLLLLGPPKGDRIIRFQGDSIRSLSPDERSIASFIQKALAVPAGTTFREVMPGLSIRKGTLADLLVEEGYGILDEKGEDVRRCTTMPTAFLLSDHLNFTEEEQNQIRMFSEYSLGPAVVQADHAIALLWNELDRRRAGWT